MNRENVSAKSGFRIDIWITMTQSYVEYTSLKRPVSYAMAIGLTNGLKRQGAGGRIIDVSTGEIIQEWRETKGQVRDLRQVTQSIRERHKVETP